jgi:ElaB/YqjD/DUF883 family membrane-anchored ribosome-binding protein
METNATVPANANDIRATLVRGVDQATIGAHDTINSASDAARPAVERMATNAHHVVDQVAGVAAQAAETLGVKGEQLRTAQDRLAGDVRGYLREHPVASIGIALAAGYALSRLLSPR